MACEWRQVRKEVALYKKLSHVGVVYLYETFVSRNGACLLSPAESSADLCQHSAYVLLSPNLSSTHLLYLKVLSPLGLDWTKKKL